MTRRLLKGLMVAGIMAASVIAQSLVGRASGVCDNSGPYTDTLCAGRHLYANSYLVSPNGRFRFYYQGDGNTLIYDTWNGWDPSVPLFEPHDGANILAYGVDSSGSPSAEVNMWSLNRSNTSALPYYLSWGDAQSAEHYMKLEDDGCLRAYQSDGSFYTTLWC